MNCLLFIFPTIILVAIIGQSSVLADCNQQRNCTNSLGTVLKKDIETTLQSERFRLDSLDPTSLIYNSEPSRLREISDGDLPYLNELELSTWVDKSPGVVKWEIENCNSPWESNSEFPCNQESGKWHRRIHHGVSRSFGVALLSSPDFILPRTETLLITFSFWIRSKWPEFNNLQFYFVENGVETLMTNYSTFSHITNQNWQVAEVSITNSKNENRTVSLAFHAFCGTNVEDAIAINDISVTRLTPSTDNTISSTTTESTTTSTTTESTTSSATSSSAINSTTTSSTSTETRTPTQLIDGALTTVTQSVRSERFRPDSRLKRQVLVKNNLVIP